LLEVNEEAYKRRVYFLTCLLLKDNDTAMAMLSSLGINKDDVLIEYVLILYARGQDVTAEDFLSQIGNMEKMGEQLLFLSRMRLKTIIHSMTQSPKYQGTLTSLDASLCQWVADTDESLFPSLKYAHLYSV
jgi:hypothetical protein